MRDAERIKKTIERLEQRRDSIRKRLDGVDRFDEVRHKGMKAAVELVQQRSGRALTDDELIAKVKEELDARIDRQGMWEAISDFGINVFVDVAVLYVRRRGKFLQRRLERVEARLARNHAKLRALLEPTDGAVSFGAEDGEASAGIFGSGPRASAGEHPAQWDVLPMLLMRLDRLERAVARLEAGEDDFDDLDDLDEADAPSPD